jgi:hypothetical protein
MPVVLWFEEQAYRRTRRQRNLNNQNVAKGTGSMLIATRFLIGYTAVAAVAALVIAELMIA